MNKSYFQIDFSKSKREYDLMQIRLRNEDVVEVNFSKLVSQSKYIRDKYRYTEAMQLIQEEIDEFKEKMKIKDESIKLFIKLIQEEKVELPIENYKDIYTLSEYFCIPTITSELDKISGECLFKDLNFTIQFLQDYETVNNGFENKLTIKIENFLQAHINECFSNAKFGELRVSTIYRLLNESKDTIDFNLLVDFILESAIKRFIMFKLVETDKLSEDKFYELIKFLESQEETTQQMYLEYIPLNLSLIKNMMNKYDQVLIEMNQTKQELDQTKQELKKTQIKENQTKHELDQTKQESNLISQELNQTKQKLNQTKQELDEIKIKEKQKIQESNQTKQELNQAKQELSQTKQELDQAKQALDEIKIKENQTKQELNLTKQEMNQTKQELNQIKQELDQTKQELEKTKIIENQEKQELNQTKQELNLTKQEMNQTKQELYGAKIKENQTKQELNQIKQKFNQTNKELSECQREMKQAKIVFNRAKSEKKRYTHSIIVGGFDRYNGLGEKPNNKNKNGTPIIQPPVPLSFDPSSLLSYSSYYDHSVLVTSDGSLKGIGYNNDGRISATLQKTIINDFTSFCIKDGSGRQLVAVSAVCYVWGTLYMFSKSSGSERQLVLCDCDINEGNPVFLDIGNHHPVSLFGGCDHSAAIGSEGEVIFINRNSVINSPKSPIIAVFLPNGEKASSVACCNDSIIVLSSKGSVFSSPIKSNGVLNFSIVSELLGHEIISVSGTASHFLAVSKEGNVFGRGSNGNGELCLGEDIKSVSIFTDILPLFGHEIRAVYAGYNHSLFKTREGKILSCGQNYSGPLFLSSGPGEDVYSPRETTITSDASFCIAGCYNSAVFIGSGPPINTPNTRIQEFE